MPSNTFGGGPYTVAAKTGVGRKDNGGTILMGGNIAGTNFQAIGYTYHANHTGYGATISNTGGNFPVTKALTSGGINTMTVGKYVLMRMCTQLNGVANTTLNSGAGDFGRRNLYYNSTIRTRRLVLTGGWNYVTGRPIAAADAIDTFTAETFPTRAIPGKLTYMYGAKLAKVDSYKARND